MDSELSFRAEASTSPFHSFACTIAAGWRYECRRVLHGAHAVVLSHEHSTIAQRISLSKATANYTDRHGFVQRRRRQGQRTRGAAPIHTVQFSNTFSVLSDPATAHLLHPQRRETSLPAPLQSGPVSPPHVLGATQAAALGRPHAKSQSWIWHSPCTQPYPRLRLHRHAQHMQSPHPLHDGGESGCAVTADANPLHRHHGCPRD